MKAYSLSAISPLWMSPNCDDNGNKYLVFIHWEHRWQLSITRKFTQCNGLKPGHSFHCPWSFIIPSFFITQNKLNALETKETLNHVQYDLKIVFMLLILRWFLLCYRSFLKSNKCEMRKMIYIFHVHETNLFTHASFIHYTFTQHWKLVFFQ